MDTVSQTGSGHAAADRAAAAATFVAAVATALPATSFWTMPVLVAVSGGADSVGLLIALRRLVPAGLERRLIVAHAEHDLRGAAPADREFVAALAAHLGLRYVWRRVAVRDDGGDEGLEGRARRLRYDFLGETALAHGARHVVVGHTADDQAETILQRMLRGTGLAGLGGMAAARELVPGVSLLRPLLGLRREAARGFLESIDQPWCEDASNADVRHARNFIRHEVLPRCVAGPFPAAAESLVRLGHQASLLAAAIRSAADHLLEAHASRHADGGIVLRAPELSGLDRHLLAEVFVALWRREGWPQQGMTARHYAALAAVVGDPGRIPTRAAATDLPGGVRVTALPDGWLRLRRMS
ncbi:MAG: tRNA lysidine(34) synthetase TilS [Planctomycetes bacterium]|nr:tRNA lysidine(34) synthetase TilS [Planctomycetota bacterium]